MAKHRWTSDLFEKYFPTVYYDRGCALPSTENEQRDFWNAVALAKSIAKQGPQLKLMRCFSFDEVAENWAPDFFVNRIVLESACSVGDEDGEEDGKVTFSLQAHLLSNRSWSCCRYSCTFPGEIGRP